MLRYIWKHSRVKQHLDELITARIDVFAKEQTELCIKQCDETYQKNRWKEIAETHKTHALEIYISDSLKLKLYTDSIISKYIYFDSFEKDELLFLQRFLHPGDICIDIGAHIGLFSLHASSIVGETGMVYAFEPTQKTFSRLQENISLNSAKNIQAIHTALSNTDGTAELHVASSGYDAWNSLAKPSLGTIQNTETISTKTFDTFVQTIDRKHAIKFIKIDVEGWEIPVLEGGKEFLSQPIAPTLLVEFTDQNAINAGYTCTELYNLLISFGYDLYTYDSIHNVLIPEELRDEYPYVNIIATKNKAEIEARIQ